MVLEAQELWSLSHEFYPLIIPLLSEQSSQELLELSPQSRHPIIIPSFIFIIYLYNLSFILFRHDLLIFSFHS